MRLFIAVEIPEEIRGRMGEIALELPEEGLSKVKTQNMHFTLKFLGEVEEEKVNGVKKLLHSVEFSPFSVRVRGVGVFPNEAYTRVVWVGAESPEMEGLADRVQKALEGMFAPEKFSAHLTLARVKKKTDFREFLQKHKEEEFGEFRVDKFFLMKSVLQRGGAKYSAITEFGAKPG